MMQKVVEKLIGDKAKAVLICPDWKSEWWRQLQPYVRDGELYQHEQFFDLRGPDGVRQMPSPHWGVWAYLVDCTEAQGIQAEKDAQVGRQEPHEDAQQLKDGAPAQTGNAFGHEGGDEPEAVELRGDLDQEQDKSNIWTQDWTKEYERCPEWQEMWKELKNGKWPKDVRLEENKMLRGGRWLVPSGLTKKILKEAHQQMAHTGGEKLIDMVQRQMELADEREARKFADRIKKMCEVCQAAEHPHHSLKQAIHSTPVPAHVFASVSVDLFVMPEEIVDGKVYNCLMACVDRNSGWIVATPHHTKDLTAAAVARDMYMKCWINHGIPSVLTSDRGPHFVEPGSEPCAVSTV